jgi:hypothetical protein
MLNAVKHLLRNAYRTLFYRRRSFVPQDDKRGLGFTL